MRPLLATRLHGRAEGALGAGFPRQRPPSGSLCSVTLQESTLALAHRVRQPKKGRWAAGALLPHFLASPWAHAPPSSGPLPHRPSAPGAHQGPRTGPQLGPRTPSTAQRSHESTSPQLDCQGPSHLYISQASPEKPPAHTPTCSKELGEGTSQDQARPDEGWLSGTASRCHGDRVPFPTAHGPSPTPLACCDGSPAHASLAAAPTMCCHHLRRGAILLKEATPHNAPHAVH